MSLTVAVLFGAVPASGAETDWSKSKMTTVTMSNFAFDPDKLVFERGVPYKLHFVNSSANRHNFRSPQFFQAVTVDPDDAAVVEDGSVEVDGGKSVDVRILPNSAGKYAIDCSHFLHAMFGMTASVVIE